MKLNFCMWLDIEVINLLSDFRWVWRGMPKSKPNSQHHVKNGFSYKFDFCM